MDNSRIIEYEKRVMQLRLELDQMLSEGRVDESAALNDKLQFLSVEMMHLNKQLELLKNMPQQSVQSQQLQQSQVQSQRPQQQVVESHPIQQPQQPQTMQQAIQSQNIQPQSMQPQRPHSQRPQPQRPQPAAKKTDIEGAIGKSWMGIFASVLVFISVVMFAAVLIPNLSDVAKMIIMFVFSVGLTAVSLYLLLGKNSESKLYLALTGCGVGCVYISLMVSALYFHIISPYLLFALLFIWSVGICMLLRYKNILFNIIGQIGVFIAVIIGCVYSASSVDLISLIAVFVFLALTQIVFLITNHSRSYLKNMAGHIVVYFGLVSILVANVMPGMHSNIIYVLVFMSSIIYLLGTLIFMDDGVTKALLGCSFLPFYIIMVIAEIPFVNDVVEYDNEYFYLSMIAMVAAMIVSAVMRKHEKLSIYNEIIIKMSSALMLLILAFVLKDTMFLIALYTVMFFVFSIALKDSVDFYTGVTFATIHVFTLKQVHPAFAIIAGIIVITLEIIAVIKRYDVAKKIFALCNTYLYVLGFVALIGGISEASKTAIAFIIISVLNMVFTKVLCKEPDSKNEELASLIFANTINGILIFSAMIFMYVIDAWRIPIIFVALALICLNSLMQLRHQNIALNIYVVFKFTVYLVNVVGSLLSEGIWISSVTLIFAIVCIVLGYIINKKGIRIYGLVIANLSVAKLILIDISHKSTLEYALSFFGCGVLCFVISFIYTIIEKREKVENHSNAVE